MENWETQEGLIPQHELWKGFRGVVLWLVVAVLSYNTIFKFIYDGISAKLLHQYGATTWMSDAASIYYYIGNPVLKFVSAILLASIIKKVLNLILQNKNKKIEEKNAGILTSNLSADGSYVGSQNLDEVERLNLRLVKGRMELAKYEVFFKKLDFAHSFYYWKKWYSVLAGFLSLIVTQVAAYVVVLIIAIALSIIFMVIGVEPPAILGEIATKLVSVLSLAAAIVIGFGSIPFSKSMQKRADRLQREDEQNGYSEALNRVIWDVPARYRRRKLMNKLIHVVKKKRVATVEEAIAIYERELAIKKGIVAAIMVLCMFGIANGINNALNEMEQDGHAIANDIGRSMDKSKAESERIRATDRKERELRNKAGAAQAYADRSRANAAGLRGTSKYNEGLQWANQAQKNANAAWDELNNL